MTDGEGEGLSADYTNSRTDYTENLCATPILSKGMFKLVIYIGFDRLSLTYHLVYLVTYLHINPINQYYRLPSTVYRLPTLYNIMPIKAKKAVPSTK
jgi:hypothetical protein